MFIRSSLRHQTLGGVCAAIENTGNLDLRIFLVKLPVEGLEIGATIDTELPLLLGHFHRFVPIGFPSIDLRRHSSGDADGKKRGDDDEKLFRKLHKHWLPTNLVLLTSLFFFAVRGGVDPSLLTLHASRFLLA